MKDKNKIYFWLSILSFFILSTSFLLMPIQVVVINRIMGVVFWVSLLCGILTQILLSRSISRERKNNKKALENGQNSSKAELEEEKNRVFGNIGIFSFLRNPIAMLADLLLAVSFFGFLLVMLFTDRSGYICFIFIALLIFSFSMHCIWNGKCCFYLFHLSNPLKNKKNKEKETEENELEEKA